MNLLSSSAPQYKIKRHRLARSVKLRVSHGAGLEITVPYRFNLNELPAILEENKGWIEKHLAVTKIQPVLEMPRSIYLAATDELWAVIYLKSSAKTKLMQRSHTKEIVLIGNCDDHRIIQALLMKWLKNQAKIKLPILLDQISQKMQLPYESVTVRSQKTLWGSCTVNKVINLNYKLLIIPAHLTQHVLIHEMSHTVHLNHSAKFWKLVAKYDALWKKHRAELRHVDRLIPTWIS